MRKVLIVLMSLTALAGCGLRGDLVRPVPLWGNPPNEGPNDPRTIKAEEERKAADRAARDTATPNTATPDNGLGRDLGAVGDAVTASAAEPPAPAPATPQ